MTLLYRSSQEGGHVIYVVSNFEYGINIEQAGVPVEEFTQRDVRWQDTSSIEPSGRERTPNLMWTVEFSTVASLKAFQHRYGPCRLGVNWHSLPDGTLISEIRILEKNWRGGQTKAAR